MVILLDLRSGTNNPKAIQFMCFYTKLLFCFVFLKILHGLEMFVKLKEKLPFITQFGFLLW